MFRRIFNTVIETTFQIQPECIAYPSPFRQPELAHLAWLPSASPCFPIKATNIQILTEPHQFYSALLENCSNAKDRITLVSLYLGTGQLETRLVDTIARNPNFKNGLRVNVLLDYMRGSRYKTNSRSMLLPLLKNDPANCRLSLYHTPEFRGLKKKITPDRFNELFGLQHMKLYIFDDTLIISGANLSNDYFTNRQDRYFVIKDKSLTDFYCGLVQRIQKFSLCVNASDELGLCSGWSQFPYGGSKNKFVHRASEDVTGYLFDAKESQNAKNYKDADTWVFPLVQMGQLGVEQDATVTARLLAEAPEGGSLHIATGYFNLTHEYVTTIMKETRAACELLMAHPNANGFMGAKGLAGGIPDAYSLIAQRFNTKLEQLGQSNRVLLKEYLKEGWTYHAKGLWYYPPQSTVPCLTLIGSPNFGERSVKRDLETQLAIVTENAELKTELHRECAQLYKRGLPVDMTRAIPGWVYAFVFLFRGYF